MSDISNISSGGIVYPVKDATARADNDTLFSMHNHTNSGRDLAELFADEIAGYSDEWAWIKARINAGNFDGLRNEDYIQLTVNGETHDMQIQIDPYYRGTDVELGHHIDFISRDCYSELVQWNTTRTNNGDSTSAYPYMVSNLKAFLDDLAADLPDKVQNVITNKRMLIEQRYSDSGLLEDSTSWGWQDLGMLWPLTEYEVFGSEIFGTKKWSGAAGFQYPIFANSLKNRIKGLGPGGSRARWWGLCVSAGNSTGACNTNSYGNAYSTSSDGTCYVTLCFRIAAD